MDDFDFTRPAQSEVYNANVARLFFHANGKVHSVAAGGALFAENTAGKGMYFLSSGEVALTRGGKPLDVIKAGEVLGEMSVLTGEPRSWEAQLRFFPGATVASRSTHAVTRHRTCLRQGLNIPGASPSMTLPTCCVTSASARHMSSAVRWEPIRRCSSACVIRRWRCR